MASDGAAPSEGAVSRAAKKAKTVTESMRGDLERSELPAAFVSDAACGWRGGGGQGAGRLQWLLESEVYGQVQKVSLRMQMVMYLNLL